MQLWFENYLFKFSRKLKGNEVSKVALFFSCGLLLFSLGLYLGREITESLFQYYSINKKILRTHFDPSFPLEKNLEGASVADGLQAQVQPQPEKSQVSEPEKAQSPKTIEPAPRQVAQTAVDEQPATLTPPTVDREQPTQVSKEREQPTDTSIKPLSDLPLPHKAEKSLTQEQNWILLHENEEPCSKLNHLNYCPMPSKIYPQYAGGQPTAKVDLDPIEDAPKNLVQEKPLQTINKIEKEEPVSTDNAKKLERQIAAVPAVSAPEAPLKIKYGIQLAATPDKVAAEKFDKQFKDLQTPTYIVNSMSKGVTLYRVCTGKFQNMKQANAAKEDLISKKIGDSHIWVNPICAEASTVVKEEIK